MSYYAATVCVLWMSHIFVSDRSGRGKEKGEERRRGWEQCESIYTSREEPEKCWGHAEPSTASLTRHHVKHSLLTFNQYMEIPGLRRRMWKPWDNERIALPTTIIQHICVVWAAVIPLLNTKDTCNQCLLVANWGPASCIGQMKFYKRRRSLRCYIVCP